MKTMHDTGHRDPGFDTLQVHGGQTLDCEARSCAVPIYQSASFGFRDAGHAARLFTGQEAGHIYSRMSNPTTDVLEKRVTLLEGGVGSVATASGTAAIFYAIFTIARTGDEFISSKALYGGTIHLFENVFRDMGITVHLVDINDRSEIEARMGKKTRALFTETIGNPMNTVADLRMLSDVAHAHGIPLIVDSTVTTPYLVRPFEHGADIVVHSLTKFMGGHGLSIGGIVTDAGTFCWDTFSALSRPDPEMDGHSFIERFGDAAYITRLRSAILRDTGACLSPFNAFTFLLGIETLSLRMAKHCGNALNVAQFLDGHPGVAWVNYPGLPNHPDHGRAEKYLRNGFGAIIAFGAKGGYEQAKEIIDSVRLFSHVANIGDTKSLIIHPASTTHKLLSEEQQLSSGVSPDMIRLCVGIEDIHDILADLEAALGKV